MIRPSRIDLDTEAPISVPSKIEYVEGDATKPEGYGLRIVTHICNDEGKWGKGFVLAISNRWKQPEHQYRQSFRTGTKPQLGDVQFVHVEPDIIVANMIGQHGIRRGPSGEPPIRYEAVEQALSTVAEYASEHGASIHMPRIGCGLAGGTWPQIEQIISRTLIAKGLEVIVYDLPA